MIKQNPFTQNQSSQSVAVVVVLIEVKVYRQSSKLEEHNVTKKITENVLNPTNERRPVKLPANLVPDPSVLIFLE